jgi:hypothetical protein
MPQFSSLAKLAGAIVPASTAGTVAGAAADRPADSVAGATPPVAAGGMPRGRPGAGIDAAGAGTMPLDTCTIGAAGLSGSSSDQLATASTLSAAINTARRADERFTD